MLGTLLVATSMAVSVSWVSPPSGAAAFAETNAQSAPQEPQEALYSALLVRAAPGRLLDLIAAYQARFETAEGQPPRAYMLRHTQGDTWDLMLLVPHGPGAVIMRPSRAPEFDPAWDALVAWREELLVRGPDLDTVRDRIEGAGYYHVEMFVALPGKRNELLGQRRMENDFLRRIERPENLIFVRVGGASWDLFTLGVYRDLKHFAESADVPEEIQEQAAVAAGFDRADRIGTYLRELIAYHNDTLAVPVR
jgi:hypothetical protein